MPNSAPAPLQRNRKKRESKREVIAGWRAVAAVCGNNRVYFSHTGISKGSHGRRENETKVQTGACEVLYLMNDSKVAAPVAACVYIQYI